MNAGQNSTHEFNIMFPAYVTQFRDCIHCINQIVYKYGLPVTYEHCFYLATYGHNPYRFAAMCMQVHSNGRPSTFDDVPDDGDDGTGIYIKS